MSTKIKRLAKQVSKHQSNLQKAYKIREEKEKVRIETREIKKKSLLDFDEYFESAYRLANRDLRNKSIYFSQIPDELLRDGLISRGAKITYVLLHSFSQVKDLRGDIEAQIAISVIRKYLGIGTDKYARKWLRELEENGWIRIIRVGKMEPNIYKLYGISKLYQKDIVRKRNIDVKIQKDWKLINRLKSSLTPSGVMRH